MVKIIFYWYFGYAISSNLTFFAYSPLPPEPLAQIGRKEMDKGGGRGRKEEKKGKGREGKGREMGKSRGEEGAGEGREHQLIFAIVCDTALSNC